MGRKRIYETLFIMSPRIEEEERENIVEKVKSNIEERVGGQIRSVDRWGTRKLAYRVRKGFSDGDYTIILFDAEAENVITLERFYSVTPEIFRWQTFRREDLEKAPPTKKPESSKAEKSVSSDDELSGDSEDTTEEIGVRVPAESSVPEETAVESEEGDNREKEA